MKTRQPTTEPPRESSACSLCCVPTTPTDCPCATRNAPKSRVAVSRSLVSSNLPFAVLVSVNDQSVSGCVRQSLLALLRCGAEQCSVESANGRHHKRGPGVGVPGGCLRVESSGDKSSWSAASGNVKVASNDFVSWDRAAGTRRRRRSRW